MKQIGKFLMIVLALMVLGLALASLSGGHLQAAPPPTQVTVLNNPLLTRDVDNPARQPFQQGFCVQVNDVGSGCPNTPTDSLAVPANSRLVIEYVSADCSGTNGVIHAVTLETVVDGLPAFHQVVNVPVGSANGFNFWAVGQPTQLYADPGSSVTIGFALTGTNPTGVCRGTISGHLITP